MPATTKRPLRAICRPFTKPGAGSEPKGSRADGRLAFWLQTAHRLMLPFPAPLACTQCKVFIFPASAGGRASEMSHSSADGSLLHDSAALACEQGRCPAWPDMIFPRIQRRLWATYGVQSEGDGGNPSSASSGWAGMHEAPSALRSQNAPKPACEVAGGVTLQPESGTGGLTRGQQHMYGYCNPLAAMLCALPCKHRATRKSSAHHEVRARADCHALHPAARVCIFSCSCRSWLQLPWQISRHSMCMGHSVGGLLLQLRPQGQAAVAGSSDPGCASHIPAPA